MSRLGRSRLILLVTISVAAWVLNRELGHKFALWAVIMYAVIALTYVAREIYDFMEKTR